MNRTDRIHQKLQAALSPNLLELKDESAKHAGHSGASADGQTHYALRIRAESLSNLSKVQAHQRIYAILAEEFSSGLHALSIEVVKAV